MTTALVAGSVVQRAGYGGHAWAFAQWVLGLRALGVRTVFVDRLVDSAPAVDSQGLAALELLDGDGGVAVIGGDGETVYGVDRSSLLTTAREADVLINVMGFLDDAEILAAPRRRVFLDIDPGFPQLWRALDLADVFDGHDAFVTVGTALPSSDVPPCGIDWLPTPPPVFLPAWPVAPPAPHAPVTSVVSWRGPFGPIEYEGRTYGLRVHEARRFVALPSRTAEALELALDIDPADDGDRLALLEHGWRLVDPRQVAGTPDDYRDYVTRSKAELMIAKHLYVATRGGWFSDRSACYLAAGRPVVAQDTGFGPALPTGDGLLAFDDLDGAADCLADLDGRYDEHCAAARALAEERLDTDVVLPRVLDEVLG